jgi:hypothetical protein
MFLSSGCATGRNTAVQNIVRGRTTVRSPDRQWIELSLHQERGPVLRPRIQGFDTQLSEIVGCPRFYGIDPKIPATTPGRQRLRTTVIRHFQAWKKTVKEAPMSDCFWPKSTRGSAEAISLQVIKLAKERNINPRTNRLSVVARGSVAVELILAVAGPDH